jgi:hypothetical protein
MLSDEGPFPIETSYLFKVQGEDIKLTLINGGQPSRFSILYSPFITIAMRLANNKDLKQVKSSLE